MSAVSITEHNFAIQSTQLQEEYIRPLLRDLHKVRRPVYWLDLLSSAAAGWIAFAVALSASWPSPVFAVAVAIAVLCLYRALCFVHELSHQAPRTLPWFELAYNALVGFPLLMPSFVYVGVHQSHHRVDIYGTEGDPEYLPFSRSWLMTTVFAAESFFIPLILLLRFVVLTPIGLISTRMQHWLTARLSSLTMNPKYCRAVTPALLTKVRRDGTIVLGLWLVLIAASGLRLTSWRWLETWLIVVSLISFLNTLRTLGAHAYESDGAPMVREAQLRDSIDTPGAFWTELWAPVGLRYHALHHYFPGIPYHNLPEAYRRIAHCLPVAKQYQRMSSPSLPHSLRELIRRGWGRLR